MIKMVPQFGPVELTSYLSTISIWTLCQYDFLIYLNKKSVVLEGIKLLQTLSPLYNLKESVTLAAPSCPDSPDYFQ